MENIGKPLHDYYVSYDMYKLFKHIGKCRTLKQIWVDCTKNERYKCDGKTPCKEEFEAWMKECNDSEEHDADARQFQ